MNIMSNVFLDQLAKWGPDSHETSLLSLAEAQKYCRTIAREHYENFAVVSWLLPKKLHQHFYNIYAYCRWSDDLADEIDSTQESLVLLSWWRNELAGCYAGHVQHPVFIALQETILRFDIPQEHFSDLLSAFKQDQKITSYQSREQLLDYCKRSANPVGRLVLRLCCRYSEENVIWSDSICTGLQLANFWQDVCRDADRGRTYLPQEECVRFGYTPEMLAARETNTEFLALMKDQVNHARTCLLAGMPLVEQMPGRMQMDIELFIRGGLRILERIELIGYRVWEERPVVTKSDQLILMVSCLMGMLWRTRLGFKPTDRVSSQTTAAQTHWAPAEDHQHT